MKKVKDVIPSTNDMREPRPEPDLTRPARVWVQLGEMYGNRFYTSFGEEAPRLWCAAIARLDDNALKRGLANLANDGSPHPPNLPEFVAACKRLPPVRTLGVPQIEDQRPPGRMSLAEWKAQQEDSDE